MTDEDEPVVRLERWMGPVDPDDPDANFKSEVAAYTQLDPLATVGNLADNLGLPVGAVVRYVLARWATGGSEGLLELGTSAVDRMIEVIERAEDAGTDVARLEAYEVLKQQISWLRHGAEQPAATYPTGGAGPRRRIRLAAYGLIGDGSRVLLVRIAPGYPGEGSWTLPGGGLDHGEDPREGARREIAEETGLEGAVGELLGVDSLRIGPDRTQSGDDLHTVRFIYRATVGDQAEPRDEPVGSTDTARWIVTDEVGTLRLADVARIGLELLRS